MTTAKATAVTFTLGARVVDRRDGQAIAGTVVEVRYDGKLLVSWPEGRYWQRPSDLLEANDNG